MEPIYASSLHFAELDKYREIFKVCADGDLEKLERLLYGNENIYNLEWQGGLHMVPLFVALHEKQEKVVNLLLDIYDRDLQACTGTSSKRVLLALPEDQTEEFWKTVENEVAEDFLPVLVKNEKNENVKTVFLRRQLENRDDLSFEIATELETKNGVCCLTSAEDSREDSFLHTAVHSEMKAVVQRLLKNPMVDVKNVTSHGHNAMHYACGASLEMVKLLQPHFENFHEDQSYLYQAAKAGKIKIVDFVTNLMVQHGSTMDGILKIPFEYKNYDEDPKHDHLFHLIAKSGNFRFFIDNTERFSDEDFCIQNSEGDTILHILVTSYVLKLNLKMKLISEIVSKRPQLLLIKNNDRRLPLHFAAFCDVQGQKLFNHVHKLTVEASENPEIFSEDVEVALGTLEYAIDLNKGLSEEYWRNFQRLLSSHGARLLQKTVSCDKSSKSLKGILSSATKVNPNEYYDGTNSFLVTLRYNIERLFSWKPGQETLMRFKMLMKYHAVQDIDARDTTGTSLFMYLVGFCEDMKILRSMITSGANCKAKNSDNVTCLHFAATNCKNSEIVKLLIDHGADPYAFDNSRRLPLNCAMTAESVPAVNMLLYYFPAESLKLKLGEKAESLIQCGVQVNNEVIFKYVLDTYRDCGVKIDVNEMNSDGENLPMIALQSSHPEKLDAIFGEAFDEIDFNHRDAAGNTFTHKFAYLQQMMQNVPLFDKFPRLRDIVNSQIYIPNTKGKTPMDDLIALYENDGWITDNHVEAFTEIITFENTKLVFHRLCMSLKMVNQFLAKFPEILNEMKSDETYRVFEKAAENPEAYRLLLKKLENKFTDTHDTNDKNLLHMICGVNSAELVDFTVKALSAVDLAALSSSLDKDSKTPFDHLNEENKIRFGKCFS